MFDQLSQRSIKELENIEFIDSLFIEGEGGEVVNLFKYISEDTLFIIDTPEAIDLKKEYLTAINKYRSLFINPLSKTDIEVKCTPQPKMNSSIQHFASELRT